MRFYEWSYGVSQGKLLGRSNVEVRNTIFRQAKLAHMDPHISEIKVSRCFAVQHGDQTRCERCQLVWDTNDHFPPACKKEAPRDIFGKDKTIAHQMLNRES